MIYLRKPQGDKLYMLIWAGEDVKEGEQFRRTVFLRLPRDLRWFLQSDSDEFKAVEFWTRDVGAILYWSELLASEMGQKLEIRESDPPLGVLYPTRFPGRV